jgi:acyl dehydratase
MAFATVNLRTTELMRYFEDFEAGAAYQLGSRVMSKADIIAFARQFDRQPFHLDEEAASRSMFGGLVASGLHTLCVAATIVDADFLAGTAMAAGAGMDKVRWIRPVRPGDEISVHLTISRVQPHARRPQLGLVGTVQTVSIQDGSIVMTGEVDYLFARRPQPG